MKDLFHFMLPFIGPILSGLGSSAVALVALVSTLRSLRKARVELTATTASMQRVVAQSLQEAADKENPDRFWTLSVVFDGGLAIAVPMFRMKEAHVGENIAMAVLDTDGKRTLCMLRCVGFGYLPRHSHKETCETIEVQSGVVTHIETGVQYRAGETWVIPADEVHSAYFQDAIVFITYRPALPTARTQPVDLTALQKVYPNPKP